MSYIFSYALLIASVYCSYKLAKEKSQSHIVWPIVTVILGPAIFIIQYLVTLFKEKIYMLKMINMWIANNIYKKSYPQNVDNF